ncbi:MAG: IS30 family transposase [Treponema sp.]|jgi:IS30 family transposase|nr:IS30 family transposase [Treponema sp.]
MNLRKTPSLKRHVRHPRVRRRKSGGKYDKRGQIPGRVWIEHRPKEVEDKLRTDDGEGDTIEGAGKTSYIATFADRGTKLLLAKIMLNKKARTLNKAAFRAFRGIPPEFLQTRTVDKGTAFACHKDLSSA